MILLIVVGLIAAALVSRAFEANDMPLEQHEQHQHGTDLLFVALLVVGGGAAAAVALGLGL
ncbi:MAG: hypothetical protein KDI12_03095 [Anaerolineae bacterium]|nr:hypothetical protein [Anaerolineae bacterium]